MDYPAASPLFFLLVALISGVEFVWRKRSGRGYDLGALGGTLGVSVGHALAKGVSAVFVAGALLWVYSLAPHPWPLDDWRSWALGFLVMEFAYYWQHRFAHTIRWFWTSHAVHHSPNELTLPAALRLGWTSSLTGAWVFYVPVVLAGLHPVALVTILTLNLRFQFFLHTEAVGKLGPLEWVFNTPSHHRVHHGSNAAYLDKNFGGVLIIFDRLFGTFAAERDDEPVVYGLTQPVTSNNPFIIAFHEWGRLIADMRRSGSIGAALRLLISRPGQPGLPAARSQAEPAPSPRPETAA